MPIPPPPRRPKDETPEELLSAARMVVARADAAWGGSWPRAAAVFTRQALEDVIKLLWTGPAAGLGQASFTAQLVCLRSYLGNDDLARRTHLTWCRLSSACHAHAYELAPTAAELTAWADTVDALIAAVGVATAAHQ
jgi:hypothetical protein